MIIQAEGRVGGEQGRGRWNGREIKGGGSGEKRERGRKRGKWSEGGERDEGLGGSRNRGRER